MRDLEDDLRQRPEDPEQRLRIGRMASLEGQPTPTFPGSGRNVYIITFTLDGTGGYEETMKVRADSKPSHHKARRMVAQNERRVDPGEVTVKNVRSP